MSPYCDSAQSPADTDYQLFSVVIHSGSTHSGHYTAYIRDVDDLGQWTHPVRDWPRPQASLVWVRVKPRTRRDKPVDEG